MVEVLLAMDGVGQYLERELDRRGRGGDATLGRVPPYDARARVAAQCRRLTCSDDDRRGDDAEDDDQPEHEHESEPAPTAVHRMLSRPRRTRSGAPTSEPAAS